MAERSAMASPGGVAPIALSTTPEATPLNSATRASNWPEAVGPGLMRAGRGR